MFEADKPNFVKIESRLAKAIEGDKPGIRTRSYYRALKRGAPWALHRKAMKNMMNDLNQKMFEQTMKPNPFMSITGLSAWLPVQIKYGDGSE